MLDSSVCLRPTESASSTRGVCLGSCLVMTPDSRKRGRGGECKCCKPAVWLETCSRAWLAGDVTILPHQLSLCKLNKSLNTCTSTLRAPPPPPPPCTHRGPYHVCICMHLVLQDVSLPATRGGAQARQSLHAGHRGCASAVVRSVS